MTKYFEFKDEKSSKFWEITLDGSTVMTCYGKIGSNGQETQKSFVDETAAQKEFDKLVREKTKKGYVEEADKAGQVADKSDQAVGESGEATDKSSKTTAKKSGSTPVATKKESTLFSIMTAADLLDKYGDKINDDFQQNFDESYADVMVYIGDAYINGDLLIDDQLFGDFANLIDIPLNEEQGKEGMSAIVVIGNLTVSGNLINVDGYDPLFYVSGNLSAKNLICGNTVMVVNGNVDIAEATLGYYNDGMMYIGGKLTTAWLSDDEHDLSAKKGIKIKYKQSIEELCEANVFIDDIEEYDDILQKLSEGGSVFTSSNEPEEKDYDYWMKLVAKNGKKLKNVPRRLINEAMAEAAVISDGEAIKHVPAALYNDDFFINIVKKDHYRSDIIPPQCYTPKLAKAMVTLGGYNLKHIPGALVTRELCIIAVKRRTEISSIPAQFLDEDILVELLKYNPEEVSKLPRRFYTLRVLVEAAKHGYFSMPHGKRFYEFYDNEIGISVAQIAREVINEGFESFDKLPGYVVTAEVYEEAEKRFATGETAEQWEECKKRHSKEFYRYLITNPESIEKLEKDPDYATRYRNMSSYCSNSFYMSKDDYVFKYIWNVFCTSDLFEEVVRSIFAGNAQASFTRYIPDDWFTEKIAWRILRNSGHNFKYLPARILDKRMCAYAIADHGGRIEDIPKELVDEELVLVAVSRRKTEFGKSDGSGYYLGHVPYQFRSLSVCKAALVSDKRALEHIPEAIKKQINLAI